MVKLTEEQIADFAQVVGAFARGQTIKAMVQTGSKKEEVEALASIFGLSAGAAAAFAVNLLQLIDENGPSALESARSSLESLQEHSDDKHH